ncbi:urease accessory protein [Pararhodobacter marinus]|uniref:Urease accessory protein n=1 Tax=Pararhodobacter marinus TaxID=2184063 RepID=A0A2U2CGV9_9RHOB|nr:HupE/UreJ family protein [Pararhodobacter marinus]PWE31049.1 urease accessory protein [Pararhodobacter marinus]
MRAIALALPVALPLAALPTLALAHSGGHSGLSFLSGLSHPLGGLDHVLAMLAVGLIAAQRGGASVLATPATFVCAMLAGGALGAAGLTFPAMEPMILASIIVLGALIAMAVRAPMALLLPVVAAFGLAHGWAHGAEGPATGLALYALGFALATAALHGAGIAVGRAVNRLAIRGLGALTAGAGLVLAFA